MRSSRARPPKPPSRARQIWGENLNGVLSAAMNRTSTPREALAPVPIVKDANACNLVTLASTDQFLNRRRWRADNHHTKQAIVSDEKRRVAQRCAFAHRAHAAHRSWCARRGCSLACADCVNFSAPHAFAHSTRTGRSTPSASRIGTCRRKLRDFRFQRRSTSRDCSWSGPPENESGMRRPPAARARSQ
jgi:hypothetical protein